MASSEYPERKPMPSVPTRTSEPKIPRRIASCALDERGLRSQRGRYARLAASVLAVQRKPGALEVTLAPDYDRGVLERALAVERECCPFFRFELTEAGTLLRVSVTREEE